MGVPSVRGCRRVRNVVEKAHHQPRFSFEADAVCAACPVAMKHCKSSTGAVAREVVRVVRFTRTARQRVWLVSRAVPPLPWRAAAMGVCPHRARWRNTGWAGRVARASGARLKGPGDLNRG